MKNETVATITIEVEMNHKKRTVDTKMNVDMADGIHHDLEFVVVTLAEKLANEALLVMNAAEETAKELIERDNIRRN